MAFSVLQCMFSALGFAPRDLLHFYFLVGGITAIMCADEVGAAALDVALVSDPKFVQGYLQKCWSHCVLSGFLRVD